MIRTCDLIRSITWPRFAFLLILGLTSGSNWEEIFAQASGGWIYEQYEGNEKSLEAFRRGKLTVKSFPAETVQIAPKGTMPVVAQFGKSERLLVFNMSPAGLFSSDDGGRTWTQLPIPVKLSSESGEGDQGRSEATLG